MALQQRTISLLRHFRRMWKYIRLLYSKSFCHWCCCEWSSNSCKIRRCKMRHANPPEQKHEKKLYAQFLHWESIEVQVPISARKTIFNFNAAINRKFETWNGFTFRHDSHRLEINSLQLNKSNPSCRTWRSCFNITFAAQLKHIKQTQAQGRRGKNQLRTCVMRYAAKLPRSWCIQRILVSRRIHSGRQNGLKHKWNKNAWRFKLVVALYLKCSGGAIEQTPFGKLPRSHLINPLELLHTLNGALMYVSRIFLSLSVVAQFRQKMSSQPFSPLQSQKSSLGWNRASVKYNARILSQRVLSAVCGNARMLGLWNQSVKPDAYRRH